MNLRTRNILEHMAEDAQDAIAFVSDIGNVDDFASNRLYRKAVVMSILNIGELTKQLPQEFKNKHPEIPWKQIAGMRDIAAHGYNEMDDDIIWDVVKYSLPELLDFIVAILES
ncbi:MAG: DUF86 domain-containing protein [Oscillospiraceae bacterium]|nr:DUF86 domain-containing protein [Oscillospiraceae bacterium]